MVAESGEPFSADTLRANLMEVAENIAPIFEFVEGQRAAMEARGWSPTAAEQVAVTMLVPLITMALTS